MPWNRNMAYICIFNQASQSLGMSLLVSCLVNKLINLCRCKLHEFWEQHQSILAQSIINQCQCISRPKSVFNFQYPAKFISRSIKSAFNINQLAVSQTAINMCALVKAHLNESLCKASLKSSIKFLHFLFLYQSSSSSITLHWDNYLLSSFKHQQS